MGSWSSSAPTLPPEINWEQLTKGGSGTNNSSDFRFRTRASIARGAGNTFYLKCEIQIEFKSGNPASTISLGTAVSVGGGAEEDSGSVTVGNWASTTTYDTKATRYYTGSASPGTEIKFWTFQSTTSVTTKKSVYAPALITYPVTYNGNGADGGSTAAQSKVYGVDLTLQNNGFTRNGWAFTGWNTAPDGTGTDYNAGAAYSGNAALTLYAQWVQTDIPVYLNVGGTVKRIAKAYMNVGGVIRECDVYENVNGTVKELV